MTDTPIEPVPPADAPTRPSTRFNRKPLYVVAFFVATWLFAVQGLPRLLPQYFTRTAPDTATAVPVPTPDTSLADAVEGDDLRQEFARLKTEHEALRTRVAQLEEKLAAPAPASTGAAIPTDLLDRLATVETKLSSNATSIDAATVANMRSRIEASERELNELRTNARSAQSADWRKLGMISALHTVQETAATGHPFQRELDNLRTLSDGEPTVIDMIDGLQPLSVKGVETTEQLRRSYDAAVQNALSRSTGDGSFKDKVTGELSKLVTIRKVGDQPGGSDEAIIARAEAKLDQGLLEDALKELQSLTPATAQAMAPWVARANERVALQVQIDELKRNVTQTIHRIATEAPAAP